MRKRILIILGILILLAGISATGFAAMFSPKHPSDYHIGVSYDIAKKSDKPMLIVFYADWCTYCMKFMPKFNLLSKIYGGKFNFVMINVEENDDTIRLAKNSDVAGYPTVYIIDPKYDNKIHLSNAIYQDLGKFRIELDRYLRIRALLDKK